MKQVVGAAIVHRGTVLAARRTAPPAAAGRWEFPGGKVEPEESPDQALVREIAEELDCVVEVRGWLAATAPIGDTHELRVAVCSLRGGDPEPSEHDAVRWLAVDELDEVDWLEPDRPFLAELTEVLARPDTALRGIFFDEDDASAVVGRLRRDGYDAWVERERLAGEDDDDDHPWAVLTDAPQLALELLVDAHDGWLDLPEEPSLAPPPLDLPTGPRRIKNPPH